MLQIVFRRVHNGIRIGARPDRASADCFQALAGFFATGSQHFLTKLAGTHKKGIKICTCDINPVKSITNWLASTKQPLRDGNIEEGITLVAFQISSTNSGKNFVDHCGRDVTLWPLVLPHDAVPYHISKHNISVVLLLECLLHVSNVIGFSMKLRLVQLFALCHGIWILLFDHSLYSSHNDT